jgi:uncharacterized protein YecE (DUF72 family)
MSDKKAIFRCGTSNVEVPARNKEEFPEVYRLKSHLEYYASLFNSVEINRTFYKLPLPATLGKWAAQVPEEFRFSVKLWREITHVKDLRYRSEDVGAFMQTVAPVGQKKGCLLVQFPAGLSAGNQATLENLLSDITASNPDPAWRIAVEFRNPGWYTPAVCSLLDRYHAALVLHDMPRSAVATLEANADFVFKRYHGLKGDYRGSYPPEFLEKEAIAIKGWLERGKDVYAYFNNTAGGDAPRDAQLLNRLVGHPTFFVS